MRKFDLSSAEYTPCSSGHVHQINFMTGPDMPEQIISAFERDALNRETLRTQGRLFSKREYDPLSRITQMHSGSFDPESQMRSLGVSFDTTPLVRKQFSYDLNGELIQSEDVFNGTQHYTYDALGRITSTKRERPEYATLVEGGGVGTGLPRQPIFPTMPKAAASPIPDWTA